MKNWVKFQSFGGANTVTGSCHRITVTIDGYDENYLVDCGLFQGSAIRENNLLNCNIEDIITDIKAVFVTHAHVDHVGRVPMMYKCGYRGPIYATLPAIQLSKPVLADCARLQFADYEKAQKKAAKQFYFEDPPLLYSVEDAMNVINQFVAVEREDEVRINDHLSVIFYDAGHSFGSASIKLIFNNGEETFSMLFSGDIGDNNPILKHRKDTFKKNVDAVFMESTYADRLHPSRVKKWKEAREIMASTIIRGGNVISPAFAVGRTQEMLSLLYKDMTENTDWIADTFRKTEIYVDSVLAVEATKIFEKFPEEFSKEISEEFSEKKEGPFNFPNLHLIYSRDESIELCKKKDPCIIFSASGMCEGGRVLYHLINNLENPASTIVFTGYQAEGTLGRRLLDGADEVNILGKPVRVSASITSIDAYSAHADQNGLLNWLKSIESGYMLFLVHGEPFPQENLKSLILSGNCTQVVEAVETDVVYEFDRRTFTKFELENSNSKVKVKNGKNDSRRKNSKCDHESIAKIMQEIRNVSNDCDDPILKNALLKSESMIKNSIQKSTKNAGAKPPHKKILRKKYKK